MEREKAGVLKFFIKKHKNTKRIGVFSTTRYYSCSGP